MKESINALIKRVHIKGLVEKMQYQRGKHHTEHPPKLISKQYKTI